MRELSTIKTVALPAAGASASTAPLDFQSAAPGPQRGKFEIHVELPALPNLVAAKTVAVELEHSDVVDSGFVSIPGTGNMKVTGATGNGVGAALFRLYLPPLFKRYVRATATVLAAGGDNTASNLTLAVDL